MNYYRNGVPIVPDTVEISKRLSSVKYFVKCPLCQIASERVNIARKNNLTESEHFIQIH